MNFTRALVVLAFMLFSAHVLAQPAEKLIIRGPAILPSVIEAWFGYQQGAVKTVPDCNSDMSPDACLASVVRITLPEGLFVLNASVRAFNSLTVPNLCFTCETSRLVQCWVSGSDVTTWGDRISMRLIYQQFATGSWTTVREGPASVDLLCTNSVVGTQEGGKAQVLEAKIVATQVGPLTRQLQ